MIKKTILGVDFEVLDAKEMITLADSFVMNKIGTGHGEGKLYVGQYNEDTRAFWDDFVKTDYKCFMLAEDMNSFLKDAMFEFLSPSQPYQNPKKLAAKYPELLAAVSSLPLDKFLWFTVYRSAITPPRVYMNSSDEVYRMIREMGIPNISYLSILKLKRLDDGEIVYYFRQFIEYNPEDLAEQEFSEEEQEEDVKSDTSISKSEKEAIVKARRGQGVFREKLLEECPFCPITLVNDERLLIASHIKPWAAPGITNAERVDPKNGLPLTPTYDKLFDRGFISFTDDKKMMVSPWLSPMNQKRLSIYDGKSVPHLPMDAKRKAYMQYHRDNVFKK